MHIRHVLSILHEAEVQPHRRSPKECMIGVSITHGYTTHVSMDDWLNTLHVKRRVPLGYSMGVNIHAGYYIPHTLSKSLKWQNSHTVVVAFLQLHTVME